MCLPHAHHVGYVSEASLPGRSRERKRVMKDADAVGKAATDIIMQERLAVGLLGQSKHEEV